MAKEKIKLSISKPVFSAKSNNDGGNQYSGTNKGSVKPKGIVIRLILSISFLYPFFDKWMIAQSARIISDHINQTYCINPILPSYFLTFICAL